MKNTCMFKVALSLLLRDGDGPRTFLFNLLEFFATLFLFLSGGPLFCFLRGLLGINLCEFEVLLLIWGTACRTSGGMLFSDMVKAPEADLITTLTSFDGAVSGIQLLKTQRTSGDIIVVLIHSVKRDCVGNGRELSVALVRIW